MRQQDVDGKADPHFCLRFPSSVFFKCMDDRPVTLQRKRRFVSCRHHGLGMVVVVALLFVNAMFEDSCMMLHPPTYSGGRDAHEGLLRLWGGLAAAMLLVPAGLFLLSLSPP